MFLSVQDDQRRCGTFEVHIPGCHVTCPRLDTACTPLFPSALLKTVCSLHDSHTSTWKCNKASIKDQRAEWVMLTLNRTSCCKLLGKDKELGMWRVGEGRDSGKAERWKSNLFKFQKIKIMKRTQPPLVLLTFHSET